MKAATEELVIASDSRLRSAGEADECQKIFPLFGGRFCLAFCGDTQLAFPIINVVEASLKNSTKLFDNSQDITDIKPHLASIINQLNINRSIEPSEKFAECMATKFLLCGYSWKSNRFVIFKIAFNPGTGLFEFGNMRGKTIPTSRGFGVSMVAIGDEEAREAFFRTIANRRVAALEYYPIKWLQEVIDGNHANTLGGVVQVVKMYKSASALTFCSSKDGEVCLYGRKLLSYEKTCYPIMDVHDLSIYYPLANVSDTRERFVGELTTY